MLSTANKARWHSMEPIGLNLCNDNAGLPEKLLFKATAKKDWAQ